MVFEKIALVITFSPNCRALLLETKRLQKLFDSKLIVIHAGEKNTTAEKQMNSFLSDAGFLNNSVNIIWQKGDPAKVIVLLLTPLNESELQLKILAEVSRKFSSTKNADAIVEAQSVEEVISKLN